MTSKYGGKIATLGVCFVLGLSLLSSTAVSTYAQEITGKIVGFVKDQSGAVVPGATIRIRDLGTGTVRDVVSGEKDGLYVVPRLPVGRYELSVAVAGFKKYVQSPITVEVNQEARIDITLQLGPKEETVTVVGEALQTQTTTATLGKVESEKRIEDLPLNGRNFTQLGLLQPGVSPQQPGFPKGGSPAIENSFSVSGSRIDANNFLLDGITNTDPQTNDLGALPILDAIEEFKILTNSFSAEFGRQSGAIVNIITKSGTNDFHGSVWEFLRNDVLDARNFFTKEIPKLRRNQFGFTLGGPIVKNRTFFFAGYEGVRSRRGIPTSTVVPTAAERSGDFSALGKPILDPTTSAPFPGNIIPPQRISATAQTILKRFYPLPNVTGAPLRSPNFSFAPIQLLDGNQFVVKADHNVGSAHRFDVRYLFEDDDLTDPFQITRQTLIPGFPQTRPKRVQNTGIAWTSVLSPTKLNEFRFGYSRIFTLFDFQPKIKAKDVGINFDTPAGLGLPETRIFGFSGFGNSPCGPQQFADNSFQYSDTFSYNHGSHSLKAGAEIRREQENLLFRFGFNGSFTFNGSATGDAIADFLLGQGFIFFDAVGRPDMYYRSTGVNFFAQDDWKVLPKLTVSLGTRYEYNTPISEKFGRISTFFVTQPPTVGVPQSGELELVLAGQKGLGSNTTYFSDKNNWAPRLGIAYDAFGNGKLVVRSGFGVFYNQTAQNLNLQQLLTEPFYRLRLFLLPPLQDPLSGLSIGNLVINLPVNPRRRTPYMMQYNLGFQYQAARDLMFEIAYVGSQGRKLDMYRQINQPLIIPGASTPSNQDSRRPFKGRGDIFQQSTDGNSSYNGLQLSANRRFRNGLSFLASYSYSKSLDELSARNVLFNNPVIPQVVENESCRKCDHAVSDFDFTHRFVFSYSYELPLGPGRKFLTDVSGLGRKLVSGWQLNGIVTLQSGAPFTVRDLSDSCTTGGITISCRPDLLPGQSPTPSGGQSASTWFNTAAFAKVPLGTRFGNVGRNTLRSDSLRNFDFAILKRTYIRSVREDFNVEFRAEFFNLFNHTVFNIPNADISSTSFGQVFSTLIGSRETQFALKVNF
jgi:hypothetical protein